MVERRRCSARLARSGRRCGRTCRPGELLCDRHRAAADPARFYSREMPTDRQAAYEQALAIDGLDGEIALLRMLIRQHADDPNLVLKAIALLARAIATRHRFSKAQEDSLYESFLNVLRGIGEIALPEGVDGHGSDD